MTTIETESLRMSRAVLRYVRNYLSNYNRIKGDHRLAVAIDELCRVENNIHRYCESLESAPVSTKAVDDECGGVAVEDSKLGQDLQE